jgi:hypothetical protein
MFKIILCLYGALAKIQALLLAKRSPVGWGKQMCLNVRLAFCFYRSFCSLSLSFSIGGNVKGFKRNPRKKES